MITGHALDQMVAERVMGWVKQPSGEWRQGKIGAGTLHASCPEYSTHKGEAMKIVDLLALDPQIYERFIAEVPSYTAQMHVPGAATVELWERVPAEEICLAALRAVGVKV
jgi:hypothetical protein